MGFAEIAFTPKRLQDHANNKFRPENQRMHGPTIARLLAIGLAASWASQPARAQDSVAQFYKGRTVTIVAASSPGGGYDLYARLIARVLGRHIPGNPSVVVANMPGAASNLAAAHVYSVAPRDGTVIGALFMGAVVEPLFSGKTRPTHDMSRFQYIGNANRDVYVCLIRTDAPVKNFAQAMEQEVVVGGTAEGASTRDFPMLLKNLLGVKFKVVSGYPGSREINLAIERGEVQGGCGETWSSVSATYPAWFRDGTVKVLAQEDREGYPELNRQGVPLTRDFAKTDEQRQILDLIYSQTAFGRPYVVAPDVPGERVDALRKAFMAAMADPDLIAEARRIQVDVMPVAGEELQAMIATLYRTPKDLLDKARAAITGK
jgi:tripartite-type tricarboxylate transporter receptor subunit TctC